MNISEQDVRKMYALADDADGFYGPDDYTPIIQHIAPEILHLSEDAGYEGDTFVLGRTSAGEVVWVEIGWGSCSGCDELQACSTVADIVALANNISDSAKRFATPAEALDWFVSHDWAGDYQSATKKAAVEAALKILRDAISFEEIQ